ncbi:hypothetical protein MTO96_006384 [Rhipicephalus appendiculatus]
MIITARNLGWTVMKTALQPKIPLCSFLGISEVRGIVERELSQPLADAFAPSVAKPQDLFVDHLEGYQRDHRTGSLIISMAVEEAFLNMATINITVNGNFIFNARPPHRSRNSNNGRSGNASSARRPSTSDRRSHDGGSHYVMSLILASSGGSLTCSCAFLVQSRTFVAARILRVNWRLLVPLGVCPEELMVVAIRVRQDPEGVPVVTWSAGRP